MSEQKSVSNRPLLRGCISSWSTHKKDQEAPDGHNSDSNPDANPKYPRNKDTPIKQKDRYFYGSERQLDNEGARPDQLRSSKMSVNCSLKG